MQVGRLSDFSFNPIPGGVPLRAPSGFSCVIAKRRNTESLYSVTSPKHSLCTFWQKKNAGSGQVRSPEAVCWLHLRKVCNHGRARVFDWSISSLQVLVRVPLCAICRYISEFLYLWPEVRPDSWVVTFTLQAYGKILKCLLFRVNESKPPNPFSIMNNYLNRNDAGAAYWQGHRERSFEVMWRHKSFFFNKSWHDGVRDF